MRGDIIRLTWRDVRWRHSSDVTSLIRLVFRLRLRVGDVNNLVVLVLDIRVLFRIPLVLVGLENDLLAFRFLLRDLDFRVDWTDARFELETDLKEADCFWFEIQSEIRTGNRQFKDPYSLNVVVVYLFWDGDFA